MCFTPKDKKTKQKYRSVQNSYFMYKNMKLKKNWNTFMYKQSLYT